MRLVGSWIAANAPPVLELGGAVDGDRLLRFVARVSGRRAAQPFSAPRACASRRRPSR